MRKKIFLDISVPGSCFDFSEPERQAFTVNWFLRTAWNYDLRSSVITVNQLNRMGDHLLREKIGNIIGEMKIAIMDMTPEAEALALEYFRSDIIPARAREDAYQIAIASAGRIATIVTWDFRRIVNSEPLEKINIINRKFRYPAVEICTPEEVY